MEPSKINQEIQQANQGTPLEAGPSSARFAKPVATGPTPITLPEGNVPEPVEGEKKLGIEEKMAIAAQLGSLLRGPGAPAPPGGGGQGINIQPVSPQLTLRQIYGR
jgi:hypothetical protein